MSFIAVSATSYKAMYLTGVGIGICSKYDRSHSAHEANIIDVLTTALIGNSGVDVLHFYRI